MGVAVSISRTDYTSADLRALAVKSEDSAQVRRLLAVALVLEGRPRGEAAALNGMDRQTLRDWVLRYNADGVAGLKSRQSPGREPALTAQQKAELRDLVVKGPDPAVDGVVRWRCIDLRAVIARQFEVEVHVHTVSKWLNHLGLTRLQPRPFHPKKDPAAEEAYKKFPSLLKEALQGTTAATPVEIWFQDEARVGQKGTRLHLGPDWVTATDGAR